ncbi:gamma-glutamyltransferase [Amycolatopsis cynarae]|uniref:Gamma-glutamyltransferase n=1 Tax=Amycolatopsis cynarae TaxID=2995223 RepID=A0ABY7B1C0_9PSEU|nr:gamma-glutamyltransferase [Amycolatopsis sp. HUAS 11-8]WAL64711.1 gamma-glutamyltransferase [Amycolatopsis sp. HUAS 11-8]
MRVDPYTWDREEWCEQARRAGPGPKDMARGPAFAVSAQHPCSVRTGEAVLRAGGSAADAVVAMTVVDTVVQPGTSTLGGHLTMLVHDTSSGRTDTLNAGFDSVTGDGDPYDRIAERAGGRAVLVPGLIAGLDAAWQRYGRLPWGELWRPAAYFAREGFPLSQHYALVARSRRQVLTRHPEGRAIFGALVDNSVDSSGATQEAGWIFRQPQLADTLDRIGTDGAGYVYQGPWAQRLVEAVGRLDGRMTLSDLARYQARWHEPLVGTYLGKELRVCPPPHYGGAVVLLALAVAEALGLHERPPRWRSADSFYDEIQAMAGAIAARGQHDEVDDITQRIRRREFIGGPFEPPQGSHSLAAVDADGQLAVATHSVAGLPWGEAGIFVDGIAVNSARYLQPSATIPGDRVRETLATQLVLDNNRPVFAATAMGTGLHGCLMQNTVNVLAHGLDLHQAIDQDRWGFYDYDYQTGRATNAIQTEPFTPGLLDRVEEIGQPLARTDAAGRPYARRDKPQPGHTIAPTIGSWAAVAIDPGTEERLAVTEPRLMGTTTAG